MTRKPDVSAGDDREDARAVVRDRIAREILVAGPIAFDRFMELALYGEDGFYDHPPIGPDGDFVTSPHLHPWFAYAVSRAFGELHELLGSPVPGRIVEVGAGDGTLARQLLEILAGGGPLEYLAVERGAGARSALAAAGVDARTSIDELERIDGAFVLANELLDNLPFRIVRGGARGAVEVRVGLDAGRLIEVETPPEPGRATPAVAPGDQIVVPTGALAFVDTLAARMHDSYALLIDYSTDLGREVHGYRRHRVVEDVLERPGSADVTAGVDFDAIEERAAASGLMVLGRATQRAALLALGFGSWSAGDRARPEPDARAWAARSRASLLVAADGLGAHRWSLLATDGLPAPRWLRDALEHGPAD